MSAAPKPILVICRTGCCPGCQDCYGMQIGCHQEPCRCELPCTCDWAHEDENPKWQASCRRHDGSEDGRHVDRMLADMVEVEQDEVDRFSQPCDICGEVGACGYDTEGLPLIHATYPDEDES